MTAETDSSTPSPRQHRRPAGPRRSATTPESAQARRARLTAATYVLLALAGLVGTWYHNLRYVSAGGTNYLGDWFANDAAASAAVDIIVVLAVATVLYLREGAALRWRSALVGLFVLLSIVVAVSFALPLFLGLRELAVARNGARGSADAAA